MARMTDDELLQVVGPDRRTYLPEAVHVAEEELSARGVDPLVAGQDTDEPGPDSSGPLSVRQLKANRTIAVVLGGGLACIGVFLIEQGGLASVIGWPLAMGGLLFAGMALWFVNQRLGMTLPGVDDEVTRTRIRIDEEGGHLVLLEPTVSDRDLVLLSLVYGTKICWLLRSESKAIQDAFSDLIEEATLVLAGPASTPLLTGMPTALGVLASQEFGMAVPGGESYEVGLYRKRDGYSYVLNELPERGYAFNFAWHYFLFLHEVGQRTELVPRLKLAAGLYQCERGWSNDRGSDLATLKRMTDVANQQLKHWGDSEQEDDEERWCALAEVLRALLGNRIDRRIRDVLS